MVVDDAHGHVFVTGAQTDTSLVVMNDDGTKAKTITGESGAAGMALVGGTLYVARCGGGAIDEFDTATLQKTGSFSADVTASCDLVASGGRLWYPSTGTVRSVSLDSSHTVVDPGSVVPDGMLASSTGQPDQLVVGKTGVSPAALYVYDVSDPSAPSQLATTTFGGSDLRDMAVTPDGATLLLAQGSPYSISALALPGLGAATGVASYPTGPYPNAVAVSPDGATIAGGADAAYDPDVLEFDASSSTATHKWNFGSTTDLLYPRGLAFNAAGTRLFAISGDVNFTHTVTFHVLTTLPAGTLTVAASKKTVVYGKAVTITAHLGTASANKVVSIYRHAVRTGSPEKLVASGRVNAKGNLNVTVKPSATTFYTAGWAGDATHAPTSAAKERRVQVRVVMHIRTLGGYGRSGSYRLYHYAKGCSGSSHSGCPEFSGWANPSHPGYTFHVIAQAYVGGQWKTVVTAKGDSNAKGRLRFKIYYKTNAAVGVNQRVHCWLGDHSDHLGNTSPWTYYRVTS